jgi:hypothetical protein
LRTQHLFGWAYINMKQCKWVIGLIVERVRVRLR